MSTETVWKFHLDGIENPVEIPEGAILLSVAQQHGRLVLWARVNPTAPLVVRHVYVVGTGNPVPSDAGPFIGTAVCDGGAWVFHAFERKVVSRG